MRPEEDFPLLALPNAFLTSNDLTPFEGELMTTAAWALSEPCAFCGEQTKTDAWFVSKDGESYRARPICHSCYKARTL